MPFVAFLWQIHPWHICNCHKNCDPRDTDTFLFAKEKPENSGISWSDEATEVMERKLVLSTNSMTHCGILSWYFTLSLYMVTQRFPYHCCSSNHMSAISNQAWLLGFIHKLLSQKFWQVMCTIITKNRSLSVFFLSLSQSWEVSHLNQRQLLTLWCKAYFMLNMQTEIRLRCQFKIETMPSEKKGISFWLCMWVVLCRNGLGIVATVLLCWFFSVCKWGLSSVFIIN